MRLPARFALVLLATAAPLAALDLGGEWALELHPIRHGKAIDAARFRQTSGTATARSGRGVGPCGMTTLGNTTSPGGLHPIDPFWSSCNLDLAEGIGYEEMDSVSLEGLSMTHGGTNQADAALAVLQARGHRTLKW
jgi:hypothetical protein